VHLFGPFCARQGGGEASKNIKATERGVTEHNMQQRQSANLCIFDRDRKGVAVDDGDIAVAVHLRVEKGC